MPVLLTLIGPENYDEITEDWFGHAIKDENLSQDERQEVISFYNK